MLGAGNVARELIDIVADINETGRHQGADPSLHIVSLAEDAPKHPLVQGIHVISSDDVLRTDVARVRLVCAAGDPARARWIAIYERAGFKFVTCVHPSAVVSPHAVIGDGGIIYPGVFVSTGVKIGRHVLIQANCSVMHDVEIADCCTLCPGVHIGGYTTVAAGTFIGIGASVIDRVTIGHNTTVGAGATVIEDIPSNVVAVGSPSRIVNRKGGGRRK